MVPVLPNVVITSLPKSGTHLAAKFVEELGFQHLNIHACPNVTADEAHIDGVTRAYPTIPMLQDHAAGVGRLISGHMPATDEIVAATQALGFRVVFMVRDIREVAVSSMRYISRLAQDDASMRARWYWTQWEDSPRKLCAYFSTAFGGVPLNWAGVRDWREASNCLTVHFGSLVGQFGSEHQRRTFEAITTHIGAPSEQISVSILRSLFRETATYTGALSDPESLWDEKVEQHFRWVGGPELAEDIGSPMVAHPDGRRS